MFPPPLRYASAAQMFYLVPLQRPFVPAVGKELRFLTSFSLSLAETMRRDFLTRYWGQHRCRHSHSQKDIAHYRAAHIGSYDQPFVVCVILRDCVVDQVQKAEKCRDALNASITIMIAHTNATRHNKPPRTVKIMLLFPSRDKSKCPGPQRTGHRHRGPFSRRQIASLASALH